MTEWRAITGYEGRYEVSDDGQVKTLVAPRRGSPNANRVLKGGTNPKGYRIVCISPGNGARPKWRLVHHLVLEAFVEPRPPGACGLHADDNRTNNHVSNLRWGTESDNRLDAVRNGRHSEARKTHCKWGHLFEGDNLIVTDRQRRCRECDRRRKLKYDARRKEQAA